MNMNAACEPSPPAAPSPPQVDLVSKEPGDGAPTTDFAALLRAMPKNWCAGSRWRRGAHCACDAALPASVLRS